MTKIEVVIPGSHAHAVRDLIRTAGATGYTAVSGVSGFGHHGHHQGRLLFNDQAPLELLITVAPPGTADTLITALRRLLHTTAGVMFVTDTHVSRPDYFTNPDPTTSG
ncbi:nitrogen regulatory protein P-II [Mycobacterium antarcticum]|nr:nitrogen regulatory protein P-II [Mycolicibacterium sp. TUM20983]